MKKLITFVFILCFSNFAFCQTNHTIIPKPKEVKFTKTAFEINPNTLISYDSKASIALPTLDILQKRILTSTLQKLLIKTQKPTKNFIHFSHQSQIKNEAYILSVSALGVEIKASSAAGFYYAYQTLLQLLPSNVYGSSYQTGLKLKLPGVTITDEPRFGYRGFMLDVSRHYFPVYFIKKTLDQMALQKLNTFHWHLTDDQGWRIEIKKYPKLTEIGSKRIESPIDGSPTNEGDKTPHGGFYTQDEIRDIVAYAQSKHITVIPEIEMPGHSLAAMTAYPELACTSGPFEVKTKWGVEEQVLCPSEKTFEFLENVLTEVIDLFPSDYIHIGGDECPKTTWKNSAFCQELIKKEGLKNEDELQSYFIRRIDKFVNSKGRKIIGWDEILEGGLSPNATVMSWRGFEGGIAAAKQKHDVIMSSSSNLYLNYYQSNLPNEPYAFGGYLPLEQVYNTEPVPAELNATEKTYIKGVQGQLWTEYIATPEKAEYMMNPRLAAIAEVAWSDAKKDYPDFKKRLNTQFERYQYVGVNYSKAFYDIQFELTKNKTSDFAIKMSSNAPDAQIRYTIDGSEPTERSFLYAATAPPVLSNSPNLMAKVFTKTGTSLGRQSAQPFTFSKTLGRKYTYVSEPFKHKGSTPLALTDGLKGVKSNFADWIGFKGEDLNVLIDLEKPIQVSRIDIGFLSDEPSWVFLPTSLEILTSMDGKEFVSAKKIDLGESTQKLKMVQQINAGFDTKAARYIKIIAVATQRASPDKKGRFLMVDEISVF